MTWSQAPEVVAAIKSIMLDSREACGIRCRSACIT